MYVYFTPQGRGEQVVPSHIRVLYTTGTRRTGRSVSCTCTLLHREEVNRSYRRLAGLVHPDKCRQPGAEEAFKMLAQARTAVLTMMHETAV